MVINTYDIIRCRQGSQTQQCILTYISVELHVSAYIEAIIRFRLLAKSSV